MEFCILKEKKYLRKLDNNTNNFKYVETDLQKFFIKDIIDKNNNLISSEYRKKSIIGYLSTSETNSFGVTKSNKPIYLINTFEKNLPKFLVSYNGKLKGKILIKFKFLHWNFKLPFGTIEEVIGLMNQQNLYKTLLYHYDIYPKKINFKMKVNENEKKIKRKDYTKLNIFSIDPPNSTDYDDALHINEDKEFFFIGVHIAQPIYWLTENEISKALKYKFSTIYTENNQSNLWQNKITDYASLKKMAKKPAYSVIFKIYKKTNLIVETTHEPSWIVNKNNYTYSDNNDDIKKLFKITKRWNTELKDNYDLVSYWMIKTNNFIGLQIQKSGLPYRVNKIKNNDDNNNLNPFIKKIFKQKDIESAYYDRDQVKHESLGLYYYTHFTSPIRRIIDTVIHYYITYGIKIRIDLQKINYLDNQTKKFHRTIKLKSTIDKLSESNSEIGYLYKIIHPNLWEVYTEKLGFVRVEMYNIKLNYQFEFIEEDNSYIIRNKNKEKEYRWKIGDEIKISIEKTPGYFPNKTYKIIAQLND